MIYKTRKIPRFKCFLGAASNVLSHVVFKTGRLSNMLQRKINFEMNFFSLVNGKRNGVDCTSVTFYSELCALMAWFFLVIR